MGVDFSVTDVELEARYSGTPVLRTAILPEDLVSPGNTWALYGQNGAGLLVDPPIPPSDAVGRAWYDEYYGTIPGDLASGAEQNEAEWGPSGDIHLDEDGLTNLYEYRADTSPRSRDSDNDGVLDPAEDHDGDTLSNLGEQRNGSHPALVDTDDDGLGDAAEVAGLTSPAASLSPLLARVLDLDGAPGTWLEMPRSLKYALSDFTMESWVKLDTLGSAAEIVSRSVESGVLNYRLGVLPTGQVELRFTREDRSGDVTLVTPQALVPGVWTHVAGMVGPLQGGRRMQIHLDGVVVADKLTDSLPATNGVGPERIRAGTALDGMMDELRFWSAPQAVRSLLERNAPVIGTGTNRAANLTAYFRFDDSTYPGATSGHAGWTHGQVEDFTATWDWLNCWNLAATLKGAAVLLAAPAGAPVDVSGADTDNDGMPDGWEVANGLNPNADDASGDPDEDGLTNGQEYLSGTNPHLVDTDLDGLADANEDSDSDGLTNTEELNQHSTNPGLADTDDDGFSDGMEVDTTVLKGDLFITSPLYSRSPYICRSLVLNGSGIRVPSGEMLTGTDRFDALGGAWTLEAWVKPAGAAETGTIFGRTLTAGGKSFELRLDGNIPSVQFNAASGSLVKTGGTVALPAGEWTHLAGVWDNANNSLDLYVNGVSYRAQTSMLTPKQGVGRTEIGTGILGNVDEVRIWKNARTAEQIAANRDSILNSPWDPKMGTISQEGLVANYRFDDSGLTLEDSVYPLDGRDENMAIDNGVTDQRDLTYALTGAIVSAGDCAFVCGGEDDVEEDKIADWWQRMYFPQYETQAASSSTNLFPITASAIPENWRNSPAAPIGQGGDTTVLQAGNEDSAYILKDVPLDFPAGTLNPLWGTPTNRAINAFKLKFESTDVLDIVDYKIFINGTLVVAYSSDLDVNTNQRTNNANWVSNGWSVGRISPEDSEGFDIDFSANTGVLPLKWGRNRISIEAVNRNTNSQNAPAGFDVELADVQLRADYENPVLVRTATIPTVIGQQSSWALYGGNGERIRLTQLGQANPGVPPDDFAARPWSDEFYGVAQSDLNNSDSNDADKWNPDDDPDADGLLNYHEYVGDLNPLSRDTDNDGILDPSEDRDGDGLSNQREQDVGSHPLLVDTDDDGIIDVLEVAALTSSSSSLAPLISRVLELDGTAGTWLELPRNLKYALKDFSMEAWVKVDSLGAPMEIISRSIEAGVTNYRLGVLPTGQVELRFTREDRSADVTLVTPQALVPGVWTHVAGMVGPLQGGRRMQIHLDGVVVADKLTDALPATNGVGPERVRAGSGLDGMLDELRIYASPQAVRTLAERHSPTPPSTPVAHFRYDDGTYPGATSGRAGWTHGQVEDFTTTQDWLNCWNLAATLKGAAVLVAAPAGAPVDVSGSDTDGDGMPDGWEVANGLNPAVDDASGDPDGDGLNNLGEYNSGTHPFLVDTDLNGIPDGLGDADGDGLSNMAESMTYFTRPDCPDTDDDGLSDKVEVDQDTNPLDSASPYVMRFIRNDGTGYITVPGDDPINSEISGSRLNLTNFTLEATVRLAELPSDTGVPVVLIQRRVLPSGYVNYELGIGIDNLPYVRFQTDNGTEYKTVGYAPVQSGEWFHIGGRYGVDERNRNNNQLGLFYNQVKVTRDVTNAKPITGLQLGDLLLAQGLHGDLDEVRIWTKDKSEDFIDNLTGKSLLFGLDSALAGSLSPNGGRLDGPTLAVSTWTVSAWVRTDAEGGVIVQKPSGVADDGQEFYNFRIILENGIPTATYDFQAPVQPQGAPCVCRWGQARLNGDLPINDGQWHYVAYTFDGTVSRLIVDDRQVATLPHVPNVGGVDWHMQPGEPDPIAYCVGCPIRLADIAGQPLSIGSGFSGRIDEVQVWDAAIPVATLINGREAKPQPGLAGLPNLIRYFDFDNDENTRDTVVLEKMSLSSASLLGNAVVDLENSDSNAPLTVTALEILGTDLALYMPFDDGRSTFPGGCRTDGYQAVEDFAFGRRYDLRFSGTLSNVANIDFSPLPNPYGYPNPMAYPGLFPLAVDSPFRVDSDGDGMPDIYEQYFWLDPNLVTSKNRPNIGPFEDLDGDGLNNLYEYYAGSDPTFADSNGNGIIDSEEDGDKDGLSNLDEQKLGTHPGRVDTDDDGFTDLEEGKVNITGHVFAANPADSADYKDPVNLDNPDCRFRFKSMLLNGNQYRVPAPTDDRRRFNSAAWTIEASVRPTNANASGPLLRYEGAYYPTAGGASAKITYWELGLINGTPYVTMDANTTYTLAPVNMGPLVLNEWTHLAGVFDPDNDLLALYVNGTLAAQLQIVENAMSGSETAFRFPGKAWIGGAGVLGNLDEVRFWTLPRTMEQVRTGMRKLVQSNESGLEFYFRFDDGRRSTAPGVEVPDGLAANDGQGAEDYAAEHRLLANNLEIPWLYSLRDVVFACDQAVLCTRMDFDDLDRDTLPDGWENLSMLREFTTYSPIIGGSGQIVGAASFLTRIMGSEEPSFSAGLKGWRPAFTPVYSLPGIQLTETPDAAWLFKDVYIDPADIGQIEMRIGVTSPFEIYFNSTGNTNQLLNVGLDTSAIPAGETFLTLGDTGPVSPLYMSPENSAKYLRAGRNRIAVRLDNTNGGTLYEYFNFEMRAGGNRYLIRRGDDNAASDNKGLSRWWMYAKKGSTVSPPVDGLGRVWNNVNYSLDNDNDFEPDGLNTKYESMVRTNPFARDTDADAVLDTGEDFDQDGLSNLNEYQIGSDPRLVDTDDDGYPDFTEDRMATRAASSLSPAIGRALSVPGTSTDYMRLPEGPAYALDTYTIDAWVFPKAISSANIVRRTVQNATHNYSLEVNAAGQVVSRFTPWNGSADVILTSPAAIPVNQWSHLSTAFNGANGLFTLYVNGSLVASSTVQAAKRPATNGTGPHLGVVGQGFNGLIDEVRIWSTFEADRALAAAEAFPSLATITAADMVLFMRKPLVGNEAGLTAYFRMDDSTNPHGVSGENSWIHGQVENFSSLYPTDWATGWCNAASLQGAAKIVSGGNTLIPGGDCMFLTDPFAVANNPVQYLDELKSPFTLGAWNISKTAPPSKLDPDGTPLHLLTDTNAYWFCQSTVSRSGTSAMMVGGVKGRPNDHIVNTSQTFNGITNYDLKNPRLRDNQSSWMQTTVVGPGSVSFYWKASMEVPVPTINNNEADFLSFHVNSVLKAYTSDTTNNWVKVSMNLPAGLQTLRWTYAKDNFGTQGSDAGWVDDVAFLHTGPDTDGDGLPDAYEVLPAYGSNPLLVDTDADGISDSDEARLGTSLAVANVTLLGSLSMVDGLVCIDWDGVVGMKYQVQVSYDGMTTWQNAPTALSENQNSYRVAIANAPLRYCDPLSPTYPAPAMYRIVTIP